MSELSRNEKVAGAVIAATLAGSALSGCTEININKNYNNPNNTQDASSMVQMPEQQTETDPTATPITWVGTETEESNEQTPENLTVHTEKYGDLKTEYNEDTGMYHMTFSPEATKKLQTEGGEVKLSFPFQTVINMSGGELFVEDKNGEYKQWDLGNPAEQSQPVESKDEETIFIVEPGQTIYARWAPGNDSAACSFIFSPTGSFDDFPFPTTVEYDSPTEAEKAGLEPVNLQEFGTYAWYPIYDENGNITEFGLDIATTNQVEEGEKNLADLKREGGTVKFSVPFEIKALNSITGTIFYIDPKTGDVIFLNTGNPVTNNYGNSKIPANAVVIIGYLPEDNNNGFSMFISADEVNVE